MFSTSVFHPWKLSRHLRPQFEKHGACSGQIGRPFTTCQTLRSDIISSSAVVGALRRSDTFFAFVLRAIRRALADHSQTDRQVITSLWSIFDDPNLNGALDIPRNRPQRSCHERQNEAEMRDPTGRNVGCGFSFGLPSQNWRVLTPQGGRSHDIFGFRRRPRRHA